MGLDPEVREVLERIAARGDPPYQDLSPDEARAAYERVVAERRGPGYVPELVGSVQSIAVPGPAGPLEARVYRPMPHPTHPRPAHPVLVWLHGGGWVVGSHETHDDQARMLCRRAAVVVVSVDYRLAPEHPFPVAFDDAFAATSWVAANAEELGGSSARVAVGGDSAGGNLAAAVCLAARDRGGPALGAQVLVYPVVDAGLSQPSVAELAEGYGLTAATMRWYVDRYLPVAADRRDPLASPLCAPDLAGLPPAHVVTAEFDLLRDQGHDYAARLAAAGVPVTLDRRPGLVHGFFGMTATAAAAAAAADDTCAAIRALLAG